MNKHHEFKREYLCRWVDDETLYVDLDRIKSLVDVDKFRGKRPKRIALSGANRSPLDPVMRYLADILDTMIADGAVVERDNGPEGIHVIVHDVPEGLSSAALVSSIRTLRPSAVWVDTGGIGRSVLAFLQQDGVNAKPIPKVPR